MKKVTKLFSLEGKNIVVAGGAGQIGFAMVQILADARANIYIADLDVEMAKQKVNANEELKGKVNIIKLDVSNISSVDAFYQLLGDIKVHGLVNCFHFKGNTRKLDTTSNFFSGFEEYPEEAWDLVHDVNLKGSFLLSQKLLPKMKNCDAAIVNVSSTAALGAHAWTAAYSASKGGISAFSKTLAVEYGMKGLNINCVCPASIETPMSSNPVMPKDIDTRLLKKIMPLDGVNRSPDDIASTIAFLASDDAIHINGIDLRVDGGLLT